MQMKLCISFPIIIFVGTNEFLNFVLTGHSCTINCRSLSSSTFCILAFGSAIPFHLRMRYLYLSEYHAHFIGGPVQLIHLTLYVKMGILTFKEFKLSVSHVANLNSRR